MTKRKTATNSDLVSIPGATDISINETGDEMDDELSDPEIAAIEESNELDSLLGELTGGSLLDAHVNVYRHMQDSISMEYCYRCSVKEFSQDKLREKYGGGKYQIRVYSRKVAGGPKRMMAKPDIFLAAPIVAEVPANASGNMQDVITRMEYNHKIAMLQLHNEILQKQGGGSGGNSILEVIGVLAQVKDLFGGGQKSSVSELAESIRAVKELSGEFNNGEGGGKPTDMQTVLEAGKLFMPLIADAMKNKPQQSTPPVQLPARIQKPSLSPAEVFNNPTPPVKSISADEQAALNYARTQEFDFETEAGMKFFLTLLLLKAKRNVDPVLQADYIAANCTDQQLQQLDDFLALPNWLEVLSQVNPEVAEYAEWFTAMRDAYMADSDSAPIAQSAGDVAHKGPEQSAQAAIDNPPAP